MNIHEHSWINVFMNTKFMFYMEMHDDAWKFHEPKLMKFSWIIIHEKIYMNIHEHSWINVFMNTKFMNLNAIHQVFMNSSWRALMNSSWTLVHEQPTKSLMNRAWTVHAFTWTFMNKPWKLMTSWTNFRRGHTNCQSKQCTRNPIFSNPSPPQQKYENQSLISEV